MRGTSYEGTKPAGSGDDAYAGRRVALVIGNGAYHQERDVLQNPVNDTRAIAAALSRIGFCGIVRTGEDFTVDFARPGVEPLLDLDQKHLGRALAAIHRVAPGVQQAVIYYAGHGIEVGGENYLIPVDARLAHIADAEYETQPLSRALRAIEGATGLRLVILDACRNNPFGARLFGQRDAGGGLRSVEPPSTVLVAYSAKHGTTAWDGEKGGNSPFAAAMLAHIEKPGLEVVDLFREVKDDVLEATHHAQEPYLYGSPGRRKEYFLPGLGGTQGQQQSTTSYTESRAERDWARFAIAETEDVAVIEAYIAQYERTEPLWAVRARQRLAEVLALLKAREAEARREAERQAAEERERKRQEEEARAKEEAEARERQRLEQEAREREADERARQPVRIMVGTGRDDREVWIAPGSGESFRDADFAPEMLVVPAGSFMMGSPESEEGHSALESPQHEVAIPQPFAVGRFPVTFVEWDAAQADPDWQQVTGLEPRTPYDQGWGRGSRPVIAVSWKDAQAYAKWLSEKTGKAYRLLSEAGWEYAARAGTTSRYWFGDDDRELGEHAWFGDNSGGETHPVGEKTANPWGLHDMHGNVREWVEDCWNGSYANKPDSLRASGEAWTAGGRDRRVLRGGSWSNFSIRLRSAFRYWSNREDRLDDVGFRLARTLTP